MAIDNVKEDRGARNRFNKSTAAATRSTNPIQSSPTLEPPLSSHFVRRSGNYVEHFPRLKELLGNFARPGNVYAIKRCLVIDDDSISTCYTMCNREHTLTARHEPRGDREPIAGPLPARKLCSPMRIVG